MIKQRDPLRITQGEIPCVSDKTSLSTKEGCVIDGEWDGKSEDFICKKSLTPKRQSKVNNNRVQEPLSSLSVMKVWLGLVSCILLTTCFNLASQSLGCCHTKKTVSSYLPASAWQPQAEAASGSGFGLAKARPGQLPIFI